MDWQQVWRIGVAPQISTAGLEALRQALREDDPRLIQGATTAPPPLQCVSDWPVEAACPIGFTGWQDGIGTVIEVEEYFTRICHETDQRIDEPGGCRWFLNYVDETPRYEMRQELLVEVERSLAERTPARCTGN